MLKLRIALGVALVVGVLTTIISFFENARPVTILYRTAISIGIFCFVGYGIGILIENLLQKAVLKANDKGQKIDVISEQQLENDQSKNIEFSPLAAENFEKVSSNKE